MSQTMTARDKGFFRLGDQVIAEAMDDEMFGAVSNIWENSNDITISSEGGDFVIDLSDPVITVRLWPRRAHEARLACAAPPVPQNDEGRPLAEPPGSCS